MNGLRSAGGATAGVGEARPPRVAAEGQARRGEQPSLVRGRMVVIVNPATHGHAPAIVEELQRRVPSRIDLDVRLTRAAGTTTALTREALASGAGAVVAVGGDGTVAAVATAVQGTGIPLGVIPIGSTNVTARELGIPTRLEAAVALLFGPHRRVPHDVGLCGERCFLHMAGAGLDSCIFAEARPALKRQIGWLAYLPSTIHHLRYPLAQFTIVADGLSMEVRSPLVLVANGSSIITPRLALYPGIRTDDGWLDLLVFTPAGPLQLARTVERLVKHQLARSPFVSHLQARHIEIHSDPVLPLELDGDLCSYTPATITLAPAALQVIVPLR